MADDETIDRITRDWQMIQRRRGHRHSTDDLLTGWYAAENAPGASRILDLGAGIGSVGLLALWRSPGATLTSIEAQDVSFDLLQRNVELNALSSRVRTIHGDLRDFQSDLASFDLVTGSPPYFDPKAGIVPADSQKAHARFELRGDVRDYCTTARRAMTPNARFVFCFPTVQRERAHRAIRDASLCLLRSRDVIPRAEVAPLFTLFACACSTGETAAIVEPPYVVRDEAGAVTELHNRSRASFGMV